MFVWGGGKGVRWGCNACEWKGQDGSVPGGPACGASLVYLVRTVELHLP